MQWVQYNMKDNIVDFVLLGALDRDQFWVEFKAYRFSEKMLYSVEQYFWTFDDI